MPALEGDRRLAAGEQHLPRFEPRGRTRKPPPLPARFPREPSAGEARPQAESSRFAGRRLEAQPIRSHDECRVAAPAAHGRPRADQRGSVPRNVGENESDEARGRPAAKLASFDRRERLAKAIDLDDRSARPHEPADSAALGFEGQPGTRERQERRSSPGNEAEDHVPRAEARKVVESPARRPDARRVRFRVRREKDLQGGQSAGRIAPR